MDIDTRQPVTLLHISDLHFGKHFLPEVGEALRAKAQALAPNAIVVSGDLTQRAKPHEFADARAFLDSLPKVPQVVVPGNHDVPLYRIWERFFQPHALYQQYCNNELDTVLKSEALIIVGLNSTNPYRAVKGGRLSSAQLEFCEHAFANAPLQTQRVVALHHHLIPAPTFERTAPMPQAKRALEVFTRLKVDLIMAGHLHRAYIGNSLDVYSGKRRDHGIIIVQCGTSTSRRGRGLEREKNTFNWLQLSSDSIEVTHYVYFSNSNDFAPVSRHQFARPQRAYLQERLTDEPQPVEVKP